ncbi:MAG TPA: hypothetical protein PK280_13315 [Planctomycetota bacterium]|nr:hypothetical protein [Planctomycetota bacterium]
MKTLMTTFNCILLSAACSAAGEVGFATKPTAAKAGENVKIDFALSAPADVEVAVLGADGKIVRHLAAGVLGAKNPPPEPLKAGLVQSLQWDGRDDFGKPATGGPFKVRVQAGMSVKFGKILGTSPYTGTLSRDSLAVAADGSIYVKMASVVPQLHEGMPWQLRHFDKTGKYQKTLLPYAPSTPADKVPGFRLIDAGDGQMTPAHTSGLDVVLFRFGDSIFNRVVDNQVIFIDNGSARLTFFKLDGTNAVKTVAMRSAPDKLKWPGWLVPQLAFSPDGKYAYYSNVANTPYDANVHPTKMDQKFPQGRVYRQDLSKPGSDPEKFYDLELPDYDQQKYWLPDAWNKCTAAYGVDVDAKGNLFVCDLVNQGIVEVSPEGKKLSFTKAPWPEKVMVESKSGDFYVVCRLGPPKDGFVGKKLVKITGRGEAGKIAVEMPLKGSLGSSIAVDGSGSVPVIWLGSDGEVLRLEDRGAALAVAGENFLNPKDAISFVCFGDADEAAELVYVTEGMGRVWRYNGETGEGGLMPFKACDVVIGPEGTIYGWGDTGSYSGPIARYTREGKPSPLASTGKHTYGSVFGRYGRGNNAPGFAVDWQGRVYAACGFNDCHVRGYDATGKMIEYERKSRVGDEKTKQPWPAFLAYILDQGGSMRADPAGNVYALELGLPKGHVAPKGFEKDPAWARCNGTIYKFTEKGGEFKAIGNSVHSWEAVGAVASYSVPSGPISGSWASTGSVCHCTRPRFDVDPYGRLYIPNGINYKVYLIDNADNPILSFGGYGNWDTQGPQSKEPKPEIPMGWPIFTGASDKYIYVGDGLNHRVVRADKVFAAAETCEVK